MICAFNARLIDNKSPVPRLACLYLEGPKRDGLYGDRVPLSGRMRDSAAFVSHVPYRIIRICDQEGIIDERSAARMRPDSPFGSGELEFADFGRDYLFPSFVDIHCHSEFLYLKDPETEIRRDDLIGVEVVGNCGVSAYPVSDDPKLRKELESNVLSILGSWPREAGSWNDFAGFRKRFESLGVKNDILFLQGHAALRIAAMGENANRKASKSEIAKMRAMLERSLDDGAIGFSTGLYYAPCAYADEAEILELLEAVRERDGIFAIHRREEGNGGEEATREAIRFAKKSCVKLQISHLKAIGDANQKQVEPILRMIEEAREDGVDVMFDQYPYVTGSTSLASLLPPQTLKDGERVYKARLVEDASYRQKTKDLMAKPSGYDSVAQLVSHDKIFIQHSDSFPELEEMSVSQIAELWNKDGFDVILDIVARERGACVMRDVTQSEDNLVRIMSHPLSLYGTDALFAGTHWHDRSRNSSRSMLKRYSNDLGIGNLVRRATALSARRLGLEDRKVVEQDAVVRLVRYAP